MQVDELVVVLGLDASNFTDEQKKALEAFNKSQDTIERRLKGLEERNKKSAQSFGDATHAAEGLFTVLAGAGLVAFSRDIVNSAAGAGRMATNIGIATNELSAFGRMIERNGGNADSAAGSMKGLADSMQRLKWGQASDEFKLGLSQVGGGDRDTPLQLFFKLAKFAEKNSVQDVNLAAQRLGLSQEIANVAIKGGTRALAEYQKAAAGALSPDQVKKLTEMQEAWVKLDQMIRTTGNDVVTSFAPGFTAGATAVADFAEKNRTLVSILGQLLTAVTALGLMKPAAWVLRLLGFGGAAATVASVSALPGMLIKGGGVGGVALATAVAMKQDSQAGNPIRTWLREKLGIEDPGEAAPWEGSKPGKGKAASPPSGAFKSDAEKEAFIRDEAAKVKGGRKIDPNTAMAVSYGEGFKKFVGDQGSSFGAFQLHYGGIAKGGNAVPGLGDEFTKRTGLDAKDPANEKAGIVFALDYVRQHGWGDFHGAANSGISKWQGIDRGGGGNTTIGTVVIQTKTDDPKDHARAFSAELERRAGRDQAARSIAMQANSGQQ